MAIVRSGNPDVSQPFGWKVAEVELLPAEFAAGTYDITVMTLPAGTVILDAYAVCTKAATVGTSMLADIELAAGGPALVTAGVDMETIGDTNTVGTINTINAAMVASTVPIAVNAEITVTGTATVSGAVTVAVLCGRVQY